MINVKLTIHLMPWEIDNALLTFTQLKKSYYYMPSDVNVTIETVLNLSSKFVDWSNSKLPMEYFVSKYNDISLLLKNYNHIKRMYVGDEIYGFLNLQKESISKEVDYYIGVCPDIYFSEHLLFLLIESVKMIKNEYFVITPQIYKKWDVTWDEITNSDYLSVPYSEWNDADIFKIRNQIKNTDGEVSLIPIKNNKWAWWFDLYNKKFYEDLCPVQKHWTGYGPWDLYSMLLSNYVKTKGVDVCQYLLKGQTILDMSSGDLKEMGFTSYHKNFLEILSTHSPNIQRQTFESKMQQYLNEGIKNLYDKGILK